MLAAGYRDGMAATGSGMTRPGGGTEVWRFGAAASNHPSSSGDGEGTLWEWRWVIAIGRKKIIIF